MNKNANLLEIGCGSGKATVAFAKKGYNIHALDPNVFLLKKAKSNLEKYENVQYYQEKFEDVIFEQEVFDLIYAAQSFHWLDLNKRYKKVASLLKKQGILAIFANFQVNNAVLQCEVRKLYQKHCPHYNQAYYDELDTIRQEILDSQLFENVQHKDFEWSANYTKEQYLSLIQTFSWVSTLNPVNKKVFLEKVNILLIHVTEPFSVLYHSPLLLARRK